MRKKSNAFAVEQKLIKTDVSELARWRHQLTQVRCWVSGFEAAQQGNLRAHVPGQEVLWQLIQRIDDTAGRK